jgi:hypothetical protein
MNFLAKSSALAVAAATPVALADMAAAAPKPREAPSAFWQETPEQAKARRTAYLRARFPDKGH